MKTDKELQQEVRDQIADDINKMVSNQLRKGGRPYPMFVQVALAKLLAEGKRACQFSNVPLNAWAKSSIKKLGYEEVKRMAQAGESPDPEKYIIARRKNNRKNNINWRKVKKANAKNSAHVKKLFDKLPAEHKLEFLRNLASEFPPFDGYDDEAADLIDSIERGFENG